MRKFYFVKRYLLKNLSAIVASRSPVSNGVFELEQRKELSERKSLFGRGESFWPGVTKKLHNV